MKEYILSNLELLAGELSPSEREQALWKDLLIGVAETVGTEDLEEKVRETVTMLLHEAGEKSFCRNITLLQNKITGFPATPLLKMALETSAEMRAAVEEDVHFMRKMLAELATPVIRLWKGVLLVPLIGSLDSERAQGMAEKVLEETARNRAEVVIIDVTGVPVIDTATGGYLIEMFNGIKLLGSDVVLTGIKPEVAHTLVKLNIELSIVTIKRDLEDALRYATGMEEDRQGEGGLR